MFTVIESWIFSKEIKDSKSVNITPENITCKRVENSRKQSEKKDVNIVSSAKRATDILYVNGMSIMYGRNNKGERQDP